MTKQDILHTYGKSVYQIRLEVAMQMYIADPETPDDDYLEIADGFVAALLAEDVKELQAKFP